MFPRSQTFRGAARLILFGCLGIASVGESPVRDFEFRPLLPASPTPASRRAGFTSLPPDATGVTFTNLLDEERSLTNQIFLNGSGVALGDVDADGRVDLYLCGLDRPNALYRNLGNWRFEDRAEPSGVTCADQASTGASFVDLDGDRDLDLLVNGIARGTRLFLNDGSGRFTEATDAWGLRSTTGATSMALADVDGDGWLDLYVVNYRNDTMRDMPGIAFTVGTTNGVRQLLTVNGQPASAPRWAGRFSLEPSGGILENGEPDAFYLHSGTNRFLRQSWASSTSFLGADDTPFPAPHDWGLSAMFHDLDGDGSPDLYVCNDFQSPDRIWINDGHGQFRPVPNSAIRQTSLFSMGVDAADIDRDGHDDVFVADMLSPDHRLRHVQVMDANAFAQIRAQGAARPQVSRNTLFSNRGDGTFAEIARYSGVDASDWSWCPAFVDVDLDGFEDLLITTGHWRDAQHADVARELDAETERRRLSPREQLRSRRRFPRLDTANAAFRNRGDLTFAEAGAEWGFDSRRVSQGMALGDLDGDGDLDVVVNCLNDGPLILRNDTDAPRVVARLLGRPPNSRAIGARVRVRGPGLPQQSREITAGGRYLSSDDTPWAFAAGSSTNLLALEVTWRDGTKTRADRVPANHAVEIRQPEVPGTTDAGTDRASEALDQATPTPPLFEDMSHLLGHLHIDASPDDFARQPLLPHGLSHAGPGAAWFDFNGDGWEDLLVGGGQTGRLAVFRNNTQGGFVPQKARLLDAAVDHPQLGILGWREHSTNLVLLIAADGWSAPESGTSPLRAISLVTGRTESSILPPSGSGGPLAMADVDADGDLDLFVGGRPLSGRFPLSTPSFLLRAENGDLRHDPRTTTTWTNLGSVNSAVFTDLDLDGHPELVVAGEWAPLRVFRLRSTTVTPWDPALVWPPDRPPSTPPARRLSELTGWWNSVVAGDFDNDGRPDLIAGNWGRNTSRQRFLAAPLHLRFRTDEARTDLPLLEIHTDPRAREPVAHHDRASLGASFPGILNRFPSFDSFAKADLPAILEATGPMPESRSTATLDSVLLSSRGDSFEVRALPGPVQFAPVFGLAVGDFDGDGNEDVFVAQNHYRPHPTEDRLDAGTGVILRGLGDGRFKSMLPADSGIRVQGDARSAAVADFDQDGRVDLVVTQNRGPTRLFRNGNGSPGLRVRLTGPERNPKAIGAVVRLEFEDGTFGPAREIRLGGGYLAQDSEVPVLGMRRPPAALHVRWPGGRAERVAVQKGAPEIRHSFR